MKTIFLKCDKAKDVRKILSEVLSMGFCAGDEAVITLKGGSKFVYVLSVDRELDENYCLEPDQNEYNKFQI